MTKSRKFTHATRGASRFAALAAAILLALGLPSQVGAQGGFDGPGRYEITNVKSGKVLDLDRNDKTTVIQYSSRRTDNQVWEVREANAGYYFLRNAMNGKALEAPGTRNSTRVQATRFDGRTDQQWRFERAKDGNALIVSRLGKTLDIPGGSESDGALVQIYENNGNSNQQFTFRLVSAAREAASRGRSSNNPTSGANRTALEPGWNMFSPAQDVELGRQAASEVAGQVPMLNDSRVDNYLNQLGQRLAANAPGHEFPYSFKTVNDRGINAFALPGGNIYINRGVIEAADTEAQLAGVMAHEISHVALRHGTNQASKASAAQMPLAILGGLLGSNDSTGAALAQLGAGFTVNSILLKYSRDAESQADLMGTQILFDSGLDSRGMGQFFSKLEGGSGTAFFNSHPNPDRRVERSNEEAALLGRQNLSRNSSREFDQIKRRLQSLPAPRSGQLQGQQPTGASSGPAVTSDRLLTFENSLMKINHPDNWQAYGQGDAVTIAPRGGMISDGHGNQALAYGVLVSLYEPHSDRSGHGQQLQGPGYGQAATISAEEATDQLVQELRQSNQNMRVVRRHQQINVGGRTALSTYLSNDSPIQGGGRETNWLVTMPRPEGLLFFVFTAPEREFQSYENSFQQVLYSLRLKD